MGDSTTPRTWMRRRMTAGAGSSEEARLASLVLLLLPPPSGPLHPPHAHAAARSLIWAVRPAARWGGWQRPPAAQRARGAEAAGQLPAQPATLGRRGTGTA